MKVNIHNKSGFCWGVVRTVDITETTLNTSQNRNTYILGNVIHNPKEIERLAKLGLKTITHSDLDTIAQNDPEAQIIIRAHGEPPATYNKINDLNLKLIDATCPLVSNLQNRVRKYFELGFRIIIFGKKEHPEIIGLRGVCNDECIVIKTMEEAEQINIFDRKTVLMSQTTMDKHLFHRVQDFLNEKIDNLVYLGEVDNNFIARDTTCRAVTSREESLIDFANQNDIVIFVSGRESSNGKSQYNICKQHNPSSYFIEDMEEIDWKWFDNKETVGIAGATSTPLWYIEKVKKLIEDRFN